MNKETKETKIKKGGTLRKLFYEEYDAKETAITPSKDDKKDDEKQKKRLYKKIKKFLRMIKDYDLLLLQFLLFIAFIFFAPMFLCYNK